jgi:hypothetical protein
MTTTKLLTMANVKTTKGEKFGYITGILYLIPDHKICPLALAAKCSETCLVNAGKGSLSNVVKSRMRKTLQYYTDRKLFLETLFDDIRKLQVRAKKEGKQLAIRLNGTSDIPWERFPVHGFENIMTAFPGVQFYDYTKIQHRIGKTPANYDLTFSYSASNEYKIHVERALAKNARMSIVFYGQLPDTFMGRMVIDGDISDLRFLEDHNVIVGLKYKRPTHRRIDISGNPFIVGYVTKKEGRRVS